MQRWAFTLFHAFARIESDQMEQNVSIKTGQQKNRYRRLSCWDNRKYRTPLPTHGLTTKEKGWGR